MDIPDSNNYDRIPVWNGTNDRREIDELSIPT